MKRHKLSKRRSKKLFSKTARRVHRRNSMGRVMRGGFRI